MLVSALRKTTKSLLLWVSLSLVTWFMSGVISFPAMAAIQVKLSNLTYDYCPPEMAKNLVLGGGVMSANCFLISGRATNSSGKIIYNADVFGRIYDANGNDIMPERTRLGAIAEVPTGESDFQIMISAPADQPPPLELKQFKASGFSGHVRR
jgi:hypothetical protein